MPVGVDNRALPAPAVFWDLVEESLDEADFLWGLREVALAAPDRTPAEVERDVEERLLGAIEGLGLAGADGVDRVLAPALGADDPSMVAVAAHALLNGGGEPGRACFAAAFTSASGLRLEALRRGLELVPAGDLWVALTGSLDGASDAVRAAFLDACAFRAFPTRVAYGDLFATRDPDLQRAAARLLRHAPRPTRAQWLPRALSLDDRRVRETAIETGLIAGAREAWSLCREIAAAEVSGSADLLVAVTMLGAVGDQDIGFAALASPRRERAAIWALGFGGLRAGADACIDLLAQDRHARLAAEAFCAITGLDLREAGLAAPHPREPAEHTGVDDAHLEQDLQQDLEDDLTADLVPCPELLLPLPDVPGVIRWWNQHRVRFEAGTRYLGGRPASLSRLLEALETGPMGRRPPLALELAVRTQGRVQIEARGFLSEQRRRLAALTLDEETVCWRRFSVGDHAGR